MRRHHVATALTVVLLLVTTGLAGSTGARAEDGVEEKAPFSLQDLDSRESRALVEPMREYLDPGIEFLWRPRKNLVAALGVLEEAHGVNALKDIPILRTIVDQGRHYEVRFDDKKWQRATGTAFKKTSGIYMNLKSEQSQFTYTTPRSYPKERALEKILREDPYPLLVSIHEARDTANERGEASKFPGEICLKRRYPKGDFASVYENWLTLAPVAPRAKFLGEDGTLRHRFLTFVLTDFWRRYHIDFDRIVVDGEEPAAALCAMFPHIFAGLILRGGEITPEVVVNYAGVPVFVVDDAKLEKVLKDAGHPDVTGGSDRDAVVWMNQRKRKVATNFEWNMLLPEQLFPNWVAIHTPDFAAPERTLSVQVLDTEADPNTIKIEAKGIESISIFLNDLHVDLDREIRLLLNGHEEKHGPLERSVDQVFAREPEIRKNMNFGWLYPAALENLTIPERTEPAEEAAPETPPEEVGVKGTPEEEDKAKEKWDKAEAASEAKDYTRAKLYYQAVVDAGETSLKAKAEAKVAEMQAKIDAGE